MLWGMTYADGVIFHSDGIGWSRMPAPATEPLHDVWGTSANNVFAVGGAGTILNYDGTAWMLVNSVTLQTYEAYGAALKKISLS